MILFIEILVLCIALSVFVMQHKLRQKISLVGSKIIYWCSLLFISLIFNSILFTRYPGSYNVSSYFNLSTGLAFCGIFVGCVMIQVVAPSKPFKRIMNRDSKKETNIEKSHYLKELHFEAFLETLCWLAIVFTLLLEVFMTLLRAVLVTDVIGGGLNKMACLMMMMTMPIIIRQIIFYLYSIRGMQEEQDLTEIEVKFYHKLKKNNQRL